MAQSGHPEMSAICPLSVGKADIRIAYNRGLVWPHAPSPGGSTRPGMKPNGALSICNPQGEAPAPGPRPLHAKVKPRAERLTISETGAMGSRLKSSGGMGPATGKSVLSAPCPWPAAFGGLTRRHGLLCELLHAQA
jgi:hypothetical protein